LRLTCPERVSAVLFTPARPAAAFTAAAGSALHGFQVPAGGAQASRWGRDGLDRRYPPVPRARLTGPGGRSPRVTAARAGCRAGSPAETARRPAGGPGPLFGVTVPPQTAAWPAAAAGKCERCRPRSARAGPRWTRSGHARRKPARSKPRKRRLRQAAVGG